MPWHVVYTININLIKGKKTSNPRSRPWRTIGLKDVKDPTLPRPMLLNLRAAAQQWALASIILGRERLFWNLSFSFSKHFS
jgi:hypothetical protein